MSNEASQPTEPKLKLMVSSTVYGIEDTLEQIHSSLTGIGYDVWMSAMGTLRTFSTNHAFDDCLKAVQQCDLFFSIITPQYGSGVLRDQHGITHQELLLAIERNVPRWVMAHERVVIARSMFRKFGCRSIAERRAFLDSLGYDDPTKYRDLVSRENKVIDDFRVIDMYDAAIRDDIKDPAQRKGNWVQPFLVPRDILRYVESQFGNYDYIQSRLHLLKQEAAAKEAESIAKPKRAPKRVFTTTKTKRATKAIKIPTKKGKK